MKEHVIADIAFVYIKQAQYWPEIGRWAQMLTDYSWGPGYPVRPIDEISRAEFVASAYHQEDRKNPILVGAACINRFANEDGKGGRDQWFSAWVVDPGYRRRGIGLGLHQRCLARALTQHGRIRASSETEYMHEFFVTNGWRVTEGPETARNDAGQPMTLYEYVRPLP